jgi:vacuolar-type H+-ATPase subunit F/Vma7
MSTCAFIGDEVTAAGFRLAGAEVHTPAPAELPALFERLLEGPELLLLTAGFATALGPERLQRAGARDRPLLLVVPDARGRERPPDLAAMLRSRLGMTE